MGKNRFIKKLEGTKLEDFEPVDDVDRLQVIDVIEGNGPICEPYAKVQAHYTGALCKDGTIFQSSHDMGKPLIFGLHEVIQGWSDGVPGMKVGGKRRLIIPAGLAYGSSSPAKNIPPNSDLVFDIELMEIK